MRSWPRGREGRAVAGHRWVRTEAGDGEIEEGARRAGVGCAAAEMEGDRSHSSEVAVMDVMDEACIGFGLEVEHLRVRVGRCRSSVEGRCCMHAVEDWRRGLEGAHHRWRLSVLADEKGVAFGPERLQGGLPIPAFCQSSAQPGDIV